MKYIKEYNEFVKHRSGNSDSINEEFIGRLLKNLSVGASRMFGGAAGDADDIVTRYRAEMVAALNKKKVAITNFSQYVKSSESDTDTDGTSTKSDRTKELKTALVASTTNYDKQVELIRKKFDLEFNDVISSTDNKAIKNYINLQKIEVQQQLLDAENKSLLSDLTPGEIQELSNNNADFKNMIADIQNKTTALNAEKQQNAQALEQTNTDKKATDVIDKLKKDAKKDHILLYQSTVQPRDWFLIKIIDDNRVTGKRISVRVSDIDYQAEINNSESDLPSLFGKITDSSDKPAPFTINWANVRNWEYKKESGELNISGDPVEIKNDIITGGTASQWLYQRSDDDWAVVKFNGDAEDPKVFTVTNWVSDSDYESEKNKPEGESNIKSIFTEEDGGNSFTPKDWKGIKKYKFVKPVGKK